MQASIRLFSIRGIEVGLHYSWFIVFVAFSALLAEGQFPNSYPGWSQTQYWLVAVAAVLLLFFSVLFHEFGHSIVAQRRGVPVQSITLFIFGGIAGLSRDAEESGDEFLIAVAGPLASLLLSGMFGALWFVLGGISEQLEALLVYLALVNLMLAVFNMIIPGFPLDGGRVLRSIIWRVTGNMRRATRIVAAIGVGIGTLFFVGGIFIAITGGLINGLWLAAIGWFLQNAAEQSRNAVEQEVALRGVSVRDLMNHEPVTVSPLVDLETLAEEYVLKRNARGMPVTEGGRMIGIVTVTNIKDVDRSRWSEVRVREVMTPASQIKVVPPDAEIRTALEIMSDGDFHQVPVIENGDLVGLLSRFELMRYLRTREELGVQA